MKVLTFKATQPHILSFFTIFFADYQKMIYYFVNIESINTKEKLLFTTFSFYVCTEKKDQVLAICYICMIFG